MKKLIACMLCLLVLSGLALTAFAAGAGMRLSASSAAVARGETFSLTVTLSNTDPIGSGGILLSFDSSAFEIVGGSCHVSGAILADVSAANGGGVFALQEERVVSGQIFTINLRVKDSAPFGKYSISGSGSLDGGGCGVSGTGVTVVCAHSYGGASRIDDGSHERVCAVCGEKKTESHTWDSGTVEKAATCKDTGLRKLKCTACSAAKTEVIPVTGEHKYGAYSKVDDSKHSHSCGICGKTETTAHTWNSGKVTKAATCQTEGSKELTCTGCKAMKTQVVAKAAHSYTAWEKADDTGHTRRCTECDLTETEAHSYDDVWDHDENGHFRQCVCGNVTNWSAHVPGPEPTETTDQLCTVCCRLLKPNTAHAHVYDTLWTSDGVGHWHKCVQCDGKDSFATHAFENECDAECNVCGYQRTAPHIPGETREADDRGHWFPCKVCGEQANYAAHTPGDPATTSSPQLCTVCGWELASVLPHDHAYDHLGSSHVHACYCGEEYRADALGCAVCLEENKPFPWWILCVGEGVVLGGIIVFLLLRDRKKREALSKAAE